MHENLDRYIRQVQGGDLDAFAEILRHCQQPVRAWIVARCPPGGDSDDVAQKTFVEVFKRIEQYELGTDFRAWIFTIARYQLMAECTRLSRLADYHSRYVPHALSQEIQRRAEQSDDGEPARLALLEECLQQVEGQPRNILQWRYEEECPLAEIARRTERSVGAIKKQLFMLRQKLHECVERKLAQEAH